MTASSNHGASTRRPVVHGGRRIPNLWQRDLKGGGIAYDAKMRIDGSNRWIKLDARTVTDAVREVEALRVDRARGVTRENPLLNPTLAELFEEYFEHLQARVGINDERHARSQGTVANYRTSARMHITPVLGSRPVVELTVADVRRLIAKIQAKRLAPTSTVKAVAVLSTALSFAVRSGYAERNVCRDLDREDRPSAKRQSEPRYLTAAEVTTLLGAATDSFRPMFTCMVYAGLRVSETMGLLWSDVDFKANTVTVVRQLDPGGSRTFTRVKTPASADIVPLSPALRRELLEHRRRQADRNLALVRPDALVFVTRTGRARSYHAVYWALRRAADKTGLHPEGSQPIGPHDLRHTAIALAFQSGATLPEASEFARHADPTVTLRVYAGLTKDGRGGAVRKLLDAGFGT